MKILAIDYGSKRVGLAIGDTDTGLALPHKVLEAASAQELYSSLEQVVAEEEIERVVVGKPITLAGRESEQTKISLNFADSLAKYLRVPVELFDERLPSRQADAVTFGAGVPTRGRDELAAMFLLQDYLDKQKSNNF